MKTKDPNNLQTDLQNARARLAAAVEAMGSLQKSFAEIRPKLADARSELERVQAVGEIDPSSVTRLRSATDLVALLESKLKGITRRFPMARAELADALNHAASAYSDTLRPRLLKLQRGIAEFLSAYNVTSEKAGSLAASCDSIRYLHGHLLCQFASRADMTTGHWLLSLIDQALADENWLPWPSPPKLPAAVQESELELAELAAA
jgi:hypothetical protein